jgi:hypothetical protein
LTVREYASVVRRTIGKAARRLIVSGVVFSREARGNLGRPRPRGRRIVRVRRLACRRSQSRGDPSPGDPDPDLATSSPPVCGLLVVPLPARPGA